ncbi:PREDICTED: uncharacterized protein LOC109477422 [Branchiostoma belcheri]|uniref:Uncharacterized protein LOC109477422 n=1 Tax=Branchiostoma belcheri TaxID=7741 RepID=A0A6P4ZXC6_BRABE|nr:PREDICTED: uncharacterized protein LOC109477422 [Branchiostoma belcheri]
MLTKWRTNAWEDATVANLVHKLRTCEPDPIDKEAFEHLLPPKEQTDGSGSGSAEAATPPVQEQTAPTSLDPRVLQLLQQATAIVQKTNPGVDFTKNEEEMLQKIKEWKAPLKKRVENFSSAINYSIDYEGFSAINDSMKSVCLVEYPDGHGSGFLIGPKYVITANHVWEAAYTSFSQVTDPQKFLVHFHISGTRRLTFIFKPDIFLARDGNLDYAIFEIHPASPTLPAVSETMQSEGICPLGTRIVANEAGVGNEDIVVIVGHPAGQGGRKRVDFCSMVAVDAVTSRALAVLGPPDNLQWPEQRPDRGSYHTSVMFEGSSGSPCFTKHGNVVFMHICGFRPYNDREQMALREHSIVEMGVLLLGVKTHAQDILPSEVFTEIFGS